MDSIFMAQISGFAGNFEPRGWAFCEGQILSIAQNTALFSLLGTIYGGDGRTTFALPDLRGRGGVQHGTGPGLSTFQIGQKGGSETATIPASGMASHSHTATLHGETSLADSANPQDKLLAGGQHYATPIAADNKTMAAESVAVANTGSSAPVDIRPPYLAINWVIALVGPYPSRS